MEESCQRFDLGGKDTQGSGLGVNGNLNDFFVDIKAGNAPTKALWKKEIAYTKKELRPRSTT